MFVDQSVVRIGFPPEKHFRFLEYEYNKLTYIYGGYLTVPSIPKNKREMPDCTRINILMPEDVMC